MPLTLNVELPTQSENIFRTTHDEIVETKLVFVEGPDDDHFINAILKNNNIQQGVQIIRMGGISSFSKKFQAKTKENNFGKVKQLAIIVDADDSMEKAFRTIKKALVECEFTAPNKHGDIITCSKKNIQIGVFVISKPGESNGMLEDLFIDTQKDTPIIKHVDEYFSNLAQSLQKHNPQGKCKKPTPQDFRYPKNEAKAKARAIMASFYEDISTVGYAAQHGYVDMNNSSLHELRNFLKEIFK